MNSALSHIDIDGLFASAGATGIRHRAQRAIAERRLDESLALQLVAVAAQLAMEPRFVPVAEELLATAPLLRTREPDWFPSGLQ